MRYYYRFFPAVLISSFHQPSFLFSLNSYPPYTGKKLGEQSAQFCCEQRPQRLVRLLSRFGWSDAPNRESSSTKCWQSTDIL